MYRTVFIVLCCLAANFPGGLALAGNDGAALFRESCLGCHSARVRPLDNVKMTKAQWNDTIERMIDNGADVPKSKKQQLLDYLFETHGAK